MMPPNLSVPDHEGVGAVEGGHVYYAGGVLDFTLSFPAQ